MENCPTCGNPSNPCAGASSISYDAAVTACMSRLGIEKNQPLSQVLSEISAAICTIMDGVFNCSDIFISGSYSNIGFTGTDETTLCNLITAIDTRFGNILDYDFDEGAFDDSPGATTIPAMVQQIIDQLTLDFYTTDSWLFLPLAGNSSSATQHNIIMEDANYITWWTTAALIYNPTISGGAAGLGLGGGNDFTTHDLHPIIFFSPTLSNFAPRIDFSVLTAASNTLLQNTMKPNYFVDKSSVNGITLPDLSTMVIPHPVVTFTATVWNAAASNVRIFPFAGQTIQLGTEFNMSGSNINFVTLVGDGTNWRIIAQG